jgi:uncharacterized protein YndB with AHSA1/START domain
MAIDVTVETTVARPIDAVFERVATLEDWPSWLIASGIVAVQRPSTAAFLTVGERFRVDGRAAGRAATFDAVASLVEPPNRLVVEGSDDDGVTIRIDAGLVAVDAGSTTLRLSISIGLPFRFRIFEGMARPEVERAATLDIEAFRRQLESAATSVD